MAVKKVKFNNFFIYINDELDENETGIVIKNEEEEFEKTKEITPITDEDLLSDTNTDIFGGDNE